METFLQFIQDHGPIIAAWVTRELHIWGPTIKPAMLYVREQGGIVPFVASFIYNKTGQTNPPQPEAKTQTEIQK